MNRQSPQAPPQLDEIPRAHWVRIALAFLVLGVWALWAGPSYYADEWWVHGVWCFVGLAVTVPTMVRVVRMDFAQVLTDHRVMFVSSFALYFLFGSAMLTYGSELEVGAVLAHFPIGAPEALRVDGINALGFSMALFTAAFSRGRWLASQTAKTAVVASRLPATWVITALLVAGGVASYHLLTFDLGWRDGIPAGAFRNLAQLVLVAIFLSASYRGEREGTLRLFGVLVTLGLAFTNTLLFSKSGALLPVAALVAGLALRYGSRRVLPLGLAVLVSGFFILGNLTIQSRITSYSTYTMSLIERVVTVWDAWALSGDLREEDEYSYWGRLCYVPTAAAGLAFQDEDNGGDGLRLMWWVAVPRFLAPQKPQITKTSVDLYEKITGYNTSSDGQGIFASGYYHGGWFGLVLASVLCGWIVAQTSAIARAIYLNGALLMLPLSLLGLFIAFRIDGDFVSDYLGAFMFILYPILAAALFMPRVAAAPGATPASVGAAR
jgi:hypothetical protein